jgi:Tol biopolymer transport system component
MVPLAGAQAAGGNTTLVSAASDGTQANDISLSASISSNGRYVTFSSAANNLVSGDTNNSDDIFVRDLQTRLTTRASLASDGTQANAPSDEPSISADGRFVAFGSFATNLVSGDTNGKSDIFVHDRQTGTTTRVSVSSGGAQANDTVYMPAISADGRYVVFTSSASNLVPGDTNANQDVFVHDRLTAETTRVSVASSGAQGNGWTNANASISADGRYVSFESPASNLVPGDTNGTWDIFVRDRLSNTTSRVSVASNGAQANRESDGQAISANGRYVAFLSLASNLVPGDTNNLMDVFVHDRLTATTRRVSVASNGAQANAESFSPAISGDGRYVAFASTAGNLVPGDTNNIDDVFVHDLLSRQTMRVSLASDGTQANNFSDVPSLSADGASVAFLSGADNLVPGDTNNTMDVFVHENGSFRSMAAYDGWVLESTEASGLGGSLNVGGGVLLVGDDAANRQYRAILSFNTSGLPDNAVVTYAELRIRRMSVIGTDPFTTHMGLKADIRKPYFGPAAALVVSDFQAAASLNAVGTFSQTAASGGWHSARLSATAYPFINLAGVTQFRLRFVLDDNNDSGADYLKFYSGNSAVVADRPQLIIYYYIP